MSSIDLTQVKKVRIARDAQDVNELIAKGWVMIDSSAGKDEMQYPITHYTMAWIRDTPPPSDY
jgi:hypothetical protein